MLDLTLKRLLFSLKHLFNPAQQFPREEEEEIREQKEESKKGKKDKGNKTPAQTPAKPAQTLPGAALSTVQPALSMTQSALFDPAPALSSATPSQPASTPFRTMVLDDEPLDIEPESNKQRILLTSMGITGTMNDFFAATTIFVNMRTGQNDTEKESFYRQEIWGWMESSLERGTFKWVARSISPTYDIHALYKKISSLANRSTWISYAMEFKKIFNMTPSSDIFQYHADLMQQVKLVKAQGECLGLNQVNVLPPWMEQCLLLMAAWQTPQYHKIALEFTMDDKAVTVETLVSELEKQRLLTAHLNQAGTGFARPTRQVDVRLSATPTQEQKLCYAFQKGKCHREGCPFLHEKGPEGPKKKFVREKDKVTPKSLPKTNAEAKKKKGPKSCYRCGSEAHLAPECKFEGKCDYCKKDGHKQSVCRKKTSDNVHVKVAEEVSIRLTCVEDEAIVTMEFHPRSPTNFLGPTINDTQSTRR